MHQRNSSGNFDAAPHGPSERIAVFLPSLRGGGAERAMLMFARGLTEQGRPNVDLVVAEAVGELVSQVPAGLRVVDLRSPRVSRAVLPLKRYLRSHAPYALYSSIAHANVIAVLAKLLARVPTRIVVRESNGPLTSPSGSLAARSVLRLLPFAYKKADAVIAVSEGVKEELVRICPGLRSKIAVLPTPVVPSDLGLLCEQPNAHPWLKDDAPFMLAAGRLHPQKDFITLIHAFAEIRRFRFLRLLILGEGAERPGLERVVNDLGVVDDVSMPGFISNPFPFFKRAAVFVLSSRYEGMPNVLIQALACGTPVVATDCRSGPREILGDGRLGRLVPVGDPRALAQAVVQTLDCPRCEHAAETMEKRFGVASSVRSYLSLAGIAA